MCPTNAESVDAMPIRQKKDMARGRPREYISRSSVWIENSFCGGAAGGCGVCLLVGSSVGGERRGSSRGSSFGCGGIGEMEIVGEGVLDYRVRVKNSVLLTVDVDKIVHNS